MAGNFLGAHIRRQHQSTNSGQGQYESTYELPHLASIQSIVTLDTVDKAPPNEYNRLRDNITPGAYQQIEENRYQEPMLRKHELQWHTVIRRKIDGIADEDIKESRKCNDRGRFLRFERYCFTG
ncbi:hypothetical protein AcV7_003608 [Taiwanofungus camphoratus]|nr:hypothetical protein AcV7_003608 [Antrodia cinnamomea]